MLNNISFNIEGWVVNPNIPSTIVLASWGKNQVFELYNTISPWTWSRVTGHKLWCS